MKPSPVPRSDAAPRFARCGNCFQRGAAFRNSLHGQAGGYLVTRRPQKRRPYPRTLLTFVLLHATLEEFVRYVAGSALPIVGQDALNDIPLVGAERKATRVGLGAWAIHRGKQVDQVLAESVRAHLVEKSFSSLASVLSTLQASGIPTRRLRIRRATLDRLIRRRYQIVHEADVLRGGSLGARPPRALSRSQLTRC